MKFEFDCGCGLPSTIRLGTYVLDPELQRAFSEGWFRVFYAPSKARKCRTCGKKYAHGFAKEKVRKP